MHQNASLFLNSLSVDVCSAVSQDAAGADVPDVSWDVDSSAGDPSDADEARPAGSGVASGSAGGVAGPRPAAPAQEEPPDDGGASGSAGGVASPPPAAPVPVAGVAEAGLGLAIVPAAPEIVEALRPGWQQCVLPDGNKLVYCEETGNIGAHCVVHGLSKCRINKVSHKLPMGYFMAWFAAAKTHGQTIEQHTALKTEKDGAESYENRVRGRERAEAMPEMATAFAWEGGLGKAEPRILR
jgi:hypothetical protein